MNIDELLNYALAAKEYRDEYMRTEDDLAREDPIGYRKYVLGETVIQVHSLEGEYVIWDIKGDKMIIKYDRRLI